MNNRVITIQFMEANNFYRFSKFNTAMEFEEENIAKRESCVSILRQMDKGTRRMINDIREMLKNCF